MADILKTKIRLVPFQAHHLSDASRLSQQAGWPHTADDWALILTASRGVAAMVDDQLVGTALCADFGKVVTLNMIIVDATMRGQGLGRRLMDAVIDIAGPREMRLIATADGLPLYEKLGFRVTGQIVQHQGIALANVPECPVTIGVRQIWTAARPWIWPRTEPAAMPCLAVSLRMAQCCYVVTASRWCARSAMAM